MPAKASRHTHAGDVTHKTQLCRHNSLSNGQAQKALLRTAAEDTSCKPDQSGALRTRDELSGNKRKAFTPLSFL